MSIPLAIALLQAVETFLLPEGAALLEMVKSQIDQNALLDEITTQKVHAYYTLARIQALETNG